MGPTEGRIWDLERRIMALEHRLPRVETAAISLSQAGRQAAREVVEHTSRRPDRPPPRPEPIAGVPMLLEFSYINTSGEVDSASMTLVGSVSGDKLNWSYSSIRTVNNFGVGEFRQHGFRIQYTIGSGELGITWIAKGPSPTYYQLNTSWSGSAQPGELFRGDVDVGSGPLTAVLRRVVGGSATTFYDVEIWPFSYTPRGGGFASGPLPDIDPPYNLISATFQQLPP